MRRRQSAGLALVVWASACGTDGTALVPPGGADAQAEASIDASVQDAPSAQDAWVVDAGADVAVDAPAPMGDASLADASADVTTAPPVLSDLVVTPNPNSVLSATVSFTTSVPCTALLHVTNVSDGGAANSFDVPPVTTPSTTFHIDVLGMRAESSFVFTVTVADAASQTAAREASFATSELPAVIPPITVVTNDPARTAPGFTLMTIWKWDYAPISNIDMHGSSIVALDAEGQVVWYALPDGFPNAPKKLPNGHLVFVHSNDGWMEIDMMGNVVRSVTAAQMGLVTLHHEITPEPGTDDYLGISTELRRVPGFRTPDGGTMTLPIVGNVISEFDADGGILHQWHEFDMLDPHREGDPFLFQQPHWNGAYPDAGMTKDWTHTNAIQPDPSDDTLIASSRTQGWVYKFTRGDGGLPTRVWRLGAGGDFTLTNPGETFQYGQHAVNILPNGHLMVFDNGNERPAPDGGVDNYSRALEYALDTTNMTATIVWQYEEEPSFFAQFLGSSYLLPNGNVLLCAGGLTEVPNGNFGSPTNLKYARVMEVTHDAVPTKVLEYRVRRELGSMPGDRFFAGYSVYRATRLASLY